MQKFDVKSHLPSRRTVEIAAAVTLPVPYALYKGGEFAARKMRDYREREEQAREFALQLDEGLIDEEEYQTKVTSLYG